MLTTAETKSLESLARDLREKCDKSEEPVRNFCLYFDILYQCFTMQFVLDVEEILADTEYSVPFGKPAATEETSLKLASLADNEATYWRNHGNI